MIIFKISARRHHHTLIVYHSNHYRDSRIHSDDAIVEISRNIKEIPVQHDRHFDNSKSNLCAIRRWTSKLMHHQFEMPVKIRGMTRLLNHSPQDFS